jgi:hypothetical protein
MAAIPKISGQSAAQFFRHHSDQVFARATLEMRPRKSSFPSF